MRRRMKKTGMCALILLLCGCVASHGPMEKDNVAHVFATAAIRVFDIDHADYDVPIEEVFSTHDLVILGENRDALVSMLEFALSRQDVMLLDKIGSGDAVSMLQFALSRRDSVWGARLAGHFRVEKVLWLVRHHFLTPRRCYGWEGPDYSQLESFLTDNQYQYSITYLEAIEAITGKPIAEAIVLTPAESTRIEKHATNEKSVFYHWALWIQRKLNHQKAEQGAAADAHKPRH